MDLLTGHSVPANTFNFSCCKGADSSVFFSQVASSGRKPTRPLPPDASCYQPTAEVELAIAGCLAFPHILCVARQRNITSWSRCYVTGLWRVFPGRCLRRWWLYGCWWCWQSQVRSCCCHWSLSACLYTLQSVYGSVCPFGSLPVGLPVRLSVCQ